MDVLEPMREDLSNFVYYQLTLYQDKDAMEGEFIE
jgi:hypothetical protein